LAGFNAIFFDYLTGTYSGNLAVDY